jgi:Rhodopirellula transposase DDE domain
LGRFKNAGTDYRGQGDPLRANVHAFEDKTLGKVAPYGVYGAIANQGRVSVGITADVAEFAVASIRCWFERMGRRRLSHVAVAHLYGSDLWGDMIQWGHYHSRNRD